MATKSPKLRRRKVQIKAGELGVNKIEGVFEGLNSFFDDIGDLTTEVVRRSGMMVVSETDKLVPKDTQALAQSWQVNVIETQRGGLKVAVTYGGPTRTGPTVNAPTGIVDYAVIVHEDLETPHQNGQAKFLEVGGAMAKPRILSELIAELKAISGE